MTVWLGKSEGEAVNFGEHNTHEIKDWCKKHQGMPVRLETAVNPVSQEMRGYYFGALLPFLRTLVPEWNALSNDELHEVLKKQFNYFEAYNAITKRRERFGQSIMANDRQNKKAMEYIMRIADWVSTNYQQQMPDPEQFKKWRDSGALIDED